MDAQLAARDSLGMRALAVIDRVAFWVITAVMAAMTIVISVQVMLRYGFETSIDWADDIGRLLFVASIFLAIPLGVKEGAHIAIDALVERFPKDVQRWLTRIWAALTILLMAVVCYYAAVLVHEQWDENLPTIDISSALFLVPVCWGAFHSALHLVPILVSGVAPRQERVE
jgi:TRAP-type C4-dicarboxylate transport system permease small subunit